MISPQDWKKLLEDLKSGDRERIRKALQLIWQQFRDSFVRAAMKLTGNEHDAEDLVHEMLITLPKRLADRDRLTLGFLHGALRLMWLEIRRRRRREGGGPPNCEPADPQPDPQDQAIRAEAFQRIQEHLNELQEVERAAFTLFYGEEMQQAEIAEKLELTVRGVRAALARAREKLQRKLRRDDGSRDYGP